jgi:hypothetical protein
VEAHGPGRATEPLCGSVAPLAFALIIQEVLTHWDAVTGGLKGKAVGKPVIFGVPFSRNEAFYFLCLAFLIGALWLTRNLLRAPTGRGWVAVRDSEIAAQSMGVNLAVYKTIAFAYSAGLMGVAGALFAHKVGYLAPDIFTVLLSIGSGSPTRSTSDPVSPAWRAARSSSGTTRARRRQEPNGSRRRERRRRRRYCEGAGAAGGGGDGGGLGIHTH